MAFFKTVDHLPEGELRFPTKLFPFIWFFVSQMKKQFFIITTLYATSYIMIALIPYFIGLVAGGFEKLGQEDISLYDALFWPVVIFVVFALILQPLTVQIGVYIQSKTAAPFTNMIRRQLALYTYHHSFGFFQSDFSGRLAGKVVETPSAMREVVTTAIGSFLYAFISFVIGVFLFAIVSWQFFLISVLWLSIYVFLIYFFVPRIMRLSEKASVERSHVRGRTVDILSNIPTVKFFARARHEDSYLREKLWTTAKAYEKTDLKLWHLWICMEILSSIFWASVIFLCVWQWSQATITLAQIAMILPLTLQVNNIAWWLSEIFANFFQRLGEIEEGMEAITKPHSLLNEKNAQDIKTAGGHIHFDHAHFSYDSKTVFENLNFEIPAGQKVGLVGPSGAGKSTLIQILLRLYDIQGGAIKIDGQDISKVTQDSLRRNIAVIPQDTSLFHRTLMENIRYGRLDATDEEVMEAAKQAHAHDFIAELPQGYDTLVGERGVKLSGGQRQRIAIARAILKDAPILILDEATSALDSESERLIQESLKTLMEGKTVIAIAHRLSTIAHLDRLIVMNNGKIVEDGTHDDLRENKDGHYAKLWAMQSGGFLGE
jgi:ATP-binding cassette subfamily B multidrug efflux pump